MMTGPPDVFTDPDSAFFLSSLPPPAIAITAPTIAITTMIAMNGP